jgi:hypothetical protein
MIEDPSTASLESVQLFKHHTFGDDMKVVTFQLNGGGVALTSLQWCFLGQGSFTFDDGLEMRGTQQLTSILT